MVRGRHEATATYDGAKQKLKHVKCELIPSDHQARGQLPAGAISPLPAAAIRAFLHCQPWRRQVGRLRRNGWSQPQPDGAKMRCSGGFGLPHHHDRSLMSGWDPRGVQAPSGTSAHQSFAALGMRTAVPLGNGAQDSNSAVSTFWTQAALGLPADFCSPSVSRSRRSSGTRELARPMHVNVPGFANRQPARGNRCSLVRRWHARGTAARD